MGAGAIVVASSVVVAPLELRVRDVEPSGGRAIVLRLDLGGRQFQYEAGQAAWLGRTDQAKRSPYSIACAPSRARETGALEFLIRTDAGRHAGPHLDPLEPGVAIAVDGPIGGFTLQASLDARALLFVAGGVGIAPLRAMIQEALARPFAPLVTVVHSARAVDDFAFSAEFDAWSASGQLRIVRTVTGADDASGRPAGRITSDLLASLNLNRDTHCFVCGPDELVGNVSSLLLDAGIQPERVARETWG